MSKQKSTSKRRQPGEIVVRVSSSCFLGTTADGLDCVRIPAEGEEAYQEPDPYCFCDDDNCQEWPDVEVVCGPHAGDYLPHLSECLIVDIDHATAQGVIGCLMKERDVALAELECAKVISEDWRINLGLEREFRAAAEAELAEARAALALYKRALDITDEQRGLGHHAESYRALCKAREEVAGHCRPEAEGGER